jgi:hypothetical protein
VNVKRTNEQSEDRGQSKSKQTTRESLKTLRVYMIRVRVCVCVCVDVCVCISYALSSSISTFQWRVSTMINIYIYIYIYVYIHNLLPILQAFMFVFQKSISIYFCPSKAPPPKCSPTSFLPSMVCVLVWFLF